MKKLLSKLTISPCNLETKALCAGAWIVKLGLTLFENKQSADEFVAELFKTQDKNIMLKYANRIRVPKLVLKAIFKANDILVSLILKATKTV